MRRAVASRLDTGHVLTLSGRLPLILLFKPGCEVLGAGKAAQVWTELGEEGVADVRIHAVHCGDVDAEFLEEQAAHRCVRLLAPLDGWWRCLIGLALELGGQAVNLCEAFVGQLVVETPRLERLAQGEELLDFPIAV
jgi:hypothetical protein